MEPEIVGTVGITLPVPINKITQLAI